MLMLLLLFSKGKKKNCGRLVGLFTFWLVHLKHPYQKGRRGEISRDYYEERESYSFIRLVAAAAGSFLSFIRDVTDEKEKGGETHKQPFYFLTCYGIRKGFRWDITLFSPLPMVGQGERLRLDTTALALLGRDAVTRDLGDSVTGHKRCPCLFVPWWMDSELGNLCTVRSSRPL